MLQIYMHIAHSIESAKQMNSVIMERRSKRDGQITRKMGKKESMQLLDQGEPEMLFKVRSSGT